MALETSDILEQGGYEIGADYQIRGVLGIDPLPQVFQWLSQDPYPSQAQIDAWTVTAQAAIVSRQLVQTEKQTLRSLMGIAQQFAPQIRLCFAAISASDFDSLDELARFTAYRAALADGSVPAAFRNRVLAAFTSESLLTVNPATLPANVPQATRAAFNDFYRAFFNTWSSMLLLAV